MVWTKCISILNHRIRDAEAKEDGERGLVHNYANPAAQSYDGYLG